VSIDHVTIVIKDKYNFKALNFEMYSALNFEMYSFKVSNLNFFVSLFILGQSIQSKTLTLKGLLLVNDRVSVNEISRSLDQIPNLKKLNLNYVNAPFEKVLTFSLSLLFI
jgi:hypothetical protein